METLTRDLPPKAGGDTVGTKQLSTALMAYIEQTERSRDGSFGIDATNNIIIAFGQAAAVAAVRLADGFDIADIPAFVQLYPQALTIVKNAPLAKQEFQDLDANEALRLVRNIVEMMRFVASKANADAAVAVLPERGIEKRGIEATQAALKALSQLVVLGVRTLRDGVQITDATALVEAYPYAAQFLSYSSLALQELGSLTFEEALQLVDEILNMIESVLTALEAA